MYVLTELISAKTLEEVNRIEKYYMQRLSDNQKAKLEIVVRHAKQRINGN